MDMSNIIFIDSRVVGFSAKPARIYALCFKDTGVILLDKEKPFTHLGVRDDVSKTVVVTDAPEYVQNWQMSFDAKEELEEVIAIYQMQNRSQKIELDQSLNRFNPSNILQVRKVDKGGIQQEFDSSQLDNGHVAVLLAVWASYKIALNYSAISPPVNSEADSTLLPFSF